MRCFSIIVSVAAVAGTLLSCTNIKVTQSYTHAKKQIYEIKGIVARPNSPDGGSEIVCRISDMEYLLDQYYRLAKQTPGERRNFIHLAEILAATIAQKIIKSDTSTGIVTKLSTEASKTVRERLEWEKKVQKYIAEYGRHLPPNIKRIAMVYAEVRENGKVVVGANVYATYGWAPLDQNIRSIKMGTTTNAKANLANSAVYNFYCHTPKNRFAMTRDTAKANHTVTIIMP